MEGQYLSFIKIEKENPSHQKVLQSISQTTPYLGDLNSYSFNKSDDTITGNDYLVVRKEMVIGYLGLSPEIETALGKTVSVYYGILEKYYGNGFGKLILNEIAFVLREKTDVDVLIANVDNSNEFGIKTIERANFQMVPELSDEEETQYHRFL